MCNYNNMCTRTLQLCISKVTCNFDDPFPLTEYNITAASILTGGNADLCTLNPVIPHSGDVRLTGSSETQRPVEVYSNNQWLPLCADNFSLAHADVVCKQLRYPLALSISSIK